MIAAMKTFAAQWWVCRIRRPALTLNEMFNADWYASLMCCPRNGAYGP